MALLQPDVKYGKRTKQLFKKFDATLPYIFIAQLIALGYQPNEVIWAILYGFNKSVKNDRLEEKAKEFMEKEKINTLIKYFQEEVNKASGGNSSISLSTLISQKLNDNGEMDRETTAMELLRIADTLPDGKEKASLLMNYADIMGYKKADSKETSIRHTMFYLPATCSVCPLKQWVEANHPDALSRKEDV